MTQIYDELKNCSVFLLGKAYQKAHAEFKTLLEPYGLTNIQHLVVESVVCEPGQTAGNIGKFLILDKATLSGVIHRLNESNWIEKRVSEDDARSQKLYPTEKALSATKEILKERDRFEAKFWADFSSEEVLLFKRLLRDLIW